MGQKKRDLGVAEDQPKAGLWLLKLWALSQLLCLLPWPWWHPPLVGGPGLPQPMQSPATPAEGLSGTFFGAYPLPTFKFQPRSESVDWRRISALDVDRVARELDVAALQENITGVTFCNLDREACSRCGHPVDPVLLKVLRLAQLIIEYLLHCQDCLSTSVAQLEARLQASLGQQQRGQQELGRQADELRGVREESRRRRKMIGTLQQLLLQTGAHSYHACHLCDKTFMNATFLRGHIQRRHTGTAEGEKQKKQEQPVEEVLEELRAKLKWTQGELEAQREAERQRQLQEAEITRQKEIEAKKEFDEWKEKERAKLYEEIDKLKKLFWDEFKSVASHNSALEEKLKVLQSHSVVESNLGSLRDEESEERLRQTQELQVLREKMDIQKAEWKRKMKELQGKHAAQKQELQEQNEMLRASLSQDQRKAAARSQRQISALCAQLQEQARLIASQEEMIQTMSLRKEEGTCEGLKAVVTEDSSEEDLEDSRDGQQNVLAALRRNPTLLKQFRPILEDTLEEKLESMGIKRDAKGISIQTLRHLESLLRAQREQKARRFSEFLSLREKLVKEATSRVKEGQRKRAPASQPDTKAPVKSQQNTLVIKEAQTKSRTLHVALPSKPTEPPTSTLQSRSSHGPGLAHMPTPAPRPRAHGRSSTPASPGPGLSTPPFSSEEDSEEGNSVQRTSLQPPRGPSRMGSRPEDDWDWSDTETSEGSAQPPNKGSGGLASSGTLVQSLVKNLEKQLEAPVKKPSGGVSLFLLPNTGPQRSAVPGNKPQLSDAESDLEISSLEELPQDLGQREKSKILSRSKPPEKSDASPWSPGRPRVPGW
ncbi:cilium assembly protein DZIP1L isoform X1 [Mustela lutreola]|uniref:cilium assembly protein DZIP1L isoform X1 n=2 Tax=Mustela lutreola TaxID=9666 RepID=UPI002797415B|nr:cilium assembly protein DZIP1L isoform X1 [Mustela lutreola]XP_059018691.1 cilium assembly protein DZIP1L isoform X1 [Mustela lutreola]XP_059018692.1 cilium assembly protein DZIP1L isoform X1 [Mustela lutreola]XP_059018693.1 cilium assembly protein DZIP1L isoform X1 [Mustela lutreola]